MANNKLPEGKKLIVELDNEGYRNVFFKNKWTDFLNAVMKTGIERAAKFPKGVKGFLIDESSGLPAAEPTKPLFTPVTPQDLARAKELEQMDMTPDTEGLPPFEPFGPVEREVPGAEEQIEDK